MLNEWIMHCRSINLQRAGFLYTEQNHIHGQRREFRIWNNAQKTKGNDVKMILSSLAYITLIRLPFCMNTGERERERERIFVKKKKKKNSKSVKRFYSQVNDKE